MMVRSRPQKEISVVDKHSDVINQLSQLSGDFGLKGDFEKMIEIDEPGSQHSTSKYLGKYYKRGVKATVSYKNRIHLLDEARFDDYISVNFNPLKIDYIDLITNAFKHYISAMSAYYASIGDDEFIYIDFDKARKLNNRNKIYRIHPICYFDSELCLRAFELKPEDIVNIIKKDVDLVDLYNDGILINSRMNPLTIKEAEKINITLWKLLKI